MTENPDGFHCGSIVWQHRCGSIVWQHRVAVQGSGCPDRWQTFIEPNAGCWHVAGRSGVAPQPVVRIPEIPEIPENGIR